MGGRVADALRAFRTFLGGSDMMAYLAMMAPRLVQLKRVLKETGSIYLHCDPTASHYLKILMDAVFGPVGARPADQKKGADRGIDGRLYFHDDESGKSKQILFSVKGGSVTASQVRDLRGTIEREKAEIGVFLCFEEPTKPMLKEAAEAGLYKSSDHSTYPRVQILTVQQILEGRQAEYPLHRRDATFKRAPKSRPAAAENLMLPLEQGE